MNERDLRLILTKDCNYRCVFCHEEGVSHEIFQTLDNADYLFLYDTIKQKEWIKDVTFTWGEPLMYPNIDSLAKILYDRWAKITMVTNGSLLDKHPDIGYRLDRINVSLHTLNQCEYSDLTQTNTKLTKIISNIELIKKLHPNLDIRLNATIVKWRNDNIQDVSEMIDLADQYGLSIKFVELYPTTDPTFVPLETLVPILEELNFTKTEENERRMIFKKGESLVILTKIYCGEWNEYDTESDVSAKERDLFVSPDAWASPYPSNIRNTNFYDAIKQRNKEEMFKLLDESMSKTH